MSRDVIFVDPLAPRAYSGAPGALGGLGGTEASLVRICESLAAERPVTVLQAARDGAPEMVGGVRYDRLNLKRPIACAPTVIVVVNSWKVAIKLARMHPDARVIVWQHVFPGRHNRALAPALTAAGITVVCVSATHARWLRDFLGADAPAISYIHNAIPDDLSPDRTPRDRNLLLFASSPHKGLRQVYQRFETLRQTYPRLRLAVADPGYLSWPAGPVPDGVLPLGRTSQAGLARWMRRAICLFYPQDQFAETFGLVIAEANAVGCPALLHRGLGGNDEVASDVSQCLDTTDARAIAARIGTWRAAGGDRPLALPRPEFRLSRVVREWTTLLAPTQVRERQPLTLSI